MEGTAHYCFFLSSFEEEVVGNRCKQGYGAKKHGPTNCAQQLGLGKDLGVGRWHIVWHLHSHLGRIHWSQKI